MMPVVGYNVEFGMYVYFIPCTPVFTSS